MDVGEPHQSSLFDALPLIWSPGSLAGMSLRMPSRVAIAAGAVGWAIVIDAFLFNILLGRDSFDDDLLLRRFIGNGIVSIASAAVVVMCILFFALLEQDRTSVISRARGRALLLAPWCLLGPAVVMTAGTRWWGPHAWLIVVGVLFVGLMVSTCKQIMRLIRGERCIICGYSLIGLLDPRCPECGHELFPGQRLPASPPSLH